MRREHRWVVLGVRGHGSRDERHVGSLGLGHDGNGGNVRDARYDERYRHGYERRYGDGWYRRNTARYRHLRGHDLRHFDLRGSPRNHTGIEELQQLRALDRTR